MPDNSANTQETIHRGRFDSLMDLWSKIVEWLSFEVILTKIGRANGGDVILIRAFLISVSLSIVLWICPYIPALKFTTFAAIFAGTYAALYARFSQQWQYLANLYNGIKAAEVRAASSEATGGDVEGLQR